jgi:8-amino-7-oxononanoate synthase
MTQRPKSLTLDPAERAGLLRQLSNRGPRAPRPAAPARAPSIEEDLRRLPSYEQLDLVRSIGEVLDIADPYFRVHDGVAGAETRIAGEYYTNFSSYNYLNLNGDPRVSEAAKAAIDQYGTSVSASRLVSGERALHRKLERALADLHGAEDCIALVSGHATNVTIIGHMVGKDDLILHDALSHNSVVQGAQLSGARRLSFPHNDAGAAAELLAAHRKRHQRALIVIEGHYSMDGDIPDLPAFSALARAHNAWLMVDEAHSVGVLGKTGRGIAEHFGMDADAADFWMGTLSKTLSGCGGYIAGKKALIDYLKLATPGFVYSVGLSPPVAGAALASLEIMAREPWRVAKLNAAATRFRDKARSAGLDTGNSGGFGIVPIITGSSILAGRLADSMFRRGINVQPILHPAVPEQSARLRFFMSSEHSEAQIETTVAALAEDLPRIASQKVDLAALALRLRRLRA